MDSSYLDTAVQRLAAMWRETLADFDSHLGWHVADYVDAGMPEPLVWLYPGLPRLTALALPADAQVWAVNARVIVGKIGERYDGELVRSLWRLMPRCVNYFNAHKRLTYEDDQRPPPYFNPHGGYFAQIQPFGEFVGSNHVGIEFQHLLPFIVQQELFKE